MTTSTTPLLAALRFEPGEDVDAIMLGLLDRLHGEGIVVGGLLQDVDRDNPGQCATINVVDIRTGEKARITQNRGKEARGCKLDAQGLVSMAHHIDAAIRDRVDLIMISRFGRAEAEGNGLLACFTNALCAGIPVLTAVRDPHVSRWEAFHGGLGLELPLRHDTTLAWCRSAACRSLAEA